MRTAIAFVSILATRLLAALIIVPATAVVLVVLASNGFSFERVAQAYYAPIVFASLHPASHADRLVATVCADASALHGQSASRPICQLTAQKEVPVTRLVTSAARAASLVYVYMAALSLAFVAMFSPRSRLALRERAGGAIESWFTRVVAWIRSSFQ